MTQMEGAQVKADDSGCYHVVNEHGDILASGFATNAEAWAWIDRRSQEGRDDQDRHYRIRQSDRFS